MIKNVKHPKARNKLLEGLFKKCEKKVVNRFYF